MDFRFNIEKHPDTQLPFNVMYYVESPNNTELNGFMKQMQRESHLLDLPRTPEFFPMSFQYVSQQELSYETLISQLKKDEDTSDEALDDESIIWAAEKTREMFLADEGGGLFIRHAPTYNSDGELEPSDEVFSCDTSAITSRETAKECVNKFADTVAHTNFENATGYTVERYKHIQSTPERRGNSMGFMQAGRSFSFCSSSSEKVVSEQGVQRYASALQRMLREDGIPESEVDSILFQVCQMLPSALNTPKQLPLVIVQSGKGYSIYLQKKVIVGTNVSTQDILCDIKGPVNKSIYIYFLRKLMKAVLLHKGKAVKGITLPELVEGLKLGNEIYDEMMAIYKKFDPTYTDKTGMIRNLGDNIRNNFSEINSAFKKLAPAIFPDIYRIRGLDKVGRVYLYGVDLISTKIDLGDFDITKF